MKLLVKFNAEPALHETLIAWQKIMDYVNSFTFKTEFNSKLNKLMEEKDRNVFADQLNSEFESDEFFGPPLKECEVLDYFRNHLYLFIDRKKNELTLNEVRLPCKVKEYINIFFDKSNWTKLEDESLRTMILSWCEAVKKSQDVIEFAELYCDKYLEFPKDAYKDGCISVMFDMEHVPDIEMMAENIAHTEGINVLKVANNSYDLTTLNLLFESYSDEEDICMYEVAFMKVLGFISVFGISNEKMHGDELTIKEISVVNCCEEKIYAVDFSEQRIAEDGELTNLKFKVPGFGKRCSLDCDFLLRREEIYHNVDVVLPIKPELRESFDTVAKFIDEAAEKGIMNKDKLGFRVMENILTADYSIKSVLDRAVNSLIFGTDKIREIKKLDSINELVSFDYPISVDERIEDFYSHRFDYGEFPISIKQLKVNEIVDGQWKFSAVTMYHTERDIRNWVELIQERVGAAPAVVEIEKI